MAQHKSATEVTVAPLAERSGFQEFVHRFWKVGVLAFLAVAAMVLYQQRAKEQARSTQNEGWDGLRNMVQVESNSFGLPQVQLSDGAALEAFSTGGTGKSGAAAWAQALAAPAYFEAGDPEAAMAALASFEQRFPAHYLATYAADGETGGPSVIAAMTNRLRGLQELKAKLPALSGNPDPPADSPHVVLSTAAGEIEVALYQEVAPQHVANFLKLVEDGTYVGTKFHRIDPTFMIQGGDQNSIDGAPETWGTGDAGYTIPAEPGELYHFPGYLAMAKRSGASESSGHQFYITVAPKHQLDGQYTIFGKVVGGMNVVETISQGGIAEGTQDRAANPVTIEATRVL